MDKQDNQVFIQPFGLFLSLKSGILVLLLCLPFLSFSSEAIAASRPTTKPASPTKGAKLIQLSVRHAKQLQQTIQKAKANTIIRLLAGTYTLSKGLQILRKRKLILEGVGKVIIHSKMPQEAVITIRHSTQIIIKNIQAHHIFPSPKATSSKSIYNVHRASKVWLYRSKSSGPTATGIRLYRSRDIIISKCELQGHTSTALFVHNGMDITIHNNRLLKNAKTLQAIGRNHIQMSQNTIQSRPQSPPQTAVFFSQKILGP